MKRVSFVTDFWPAQYFQRPVRASSSPMAVTAALTAHGGGKCVTRLCTRGALVLKALAVNNRKEKPAKKSKCRTRRNAKVHSVPISRHVACPDQRHPDSSSRPMGFHGNRLECSKIRSSAAKLHPSHYKCQRAPHDEWLGPRHSRDDMPTTARSSAGSAGQPCHCTYASAGLRPSR